MLFNIIISTLSAILSITCVIILFNRLRKIPEKPLDSDIDTTNRLINDDDTQINLGKTALSQYKILDTKSTAPILYSSMCVAEDLEGSAKKLESYYKSQYQFNMESNKSYEENKKKSQ